MSFSHVFHSSVLREYDIRGIVGDTLHPADATAIGRCLGTLVRRAGGRTVAVGYDGRLSSPALEAALVQGISRFRDPGRGQGLAGIRRYLNRWEGKLAVRSGNARWGLVPPWDDDVPLAHGLPAFPGSQVLMIIPAHAGDGAGHATH